MLEFREEGDEMMHAVVRLLRACLQEVEKFLVVPEQLLNREHSRSVVLDPVVCCNVRLRSRRSGHIRLVYPEQLRKSFRTILKNVSLHPQPVLPAASTPRD